MKMNPFRVQPNNRYSNPPPPVRFLRISVRIPNALPANVFEWNHRDYLNLTAKDSDGDGIKDGLERESDSDPLDRDTDDDGLSDGKEDINRNGVVDSFETDGRNPDTDGDGLTDGLESGVIDPIPDDSDGVYRGTDTSATFMHYGKEVPTFTSSSGLKTNPLDNDTDDW